MRPAIIGICGAHSASGKTTYAALLLRNLRGWGAIKYTRTALYSSIVDDSEILSEKGKDTRIFLDAGAERVLWVQSPPSELGEVLPLAVERLSDLKGIIVEGNSAVEFLRPDIIVFIFGSDPGEIKESARGLLEEADVIVTESEASPVAREKVRSFCKSPEGKDLFIRYVREMIERKEQIKSSLARNAVDGKISCPCARKIARDLAVSDKEVGEVANKLGIKITDCELGCF